MITKIEALKYRCLKYICQELDPFQVLVGPNASGKSSFLDVIGFIGDLLFEGPEHAVSERASRAERIEELVWNGQGSRIELAVELAIPERLKRESPNLASCRYEIAVGRERASRTKVLSETLFLAPKQERRKLVQRELFPQEPNVPQTIVRGSRRTPQGWKTVLRKIEDSGNDYFKSETGDWRMQFRFGPQKTALANLPEDEDRFPVGTWVKRFLMEGIQTIALNSWNMGQPSEDREEAKLLFDGRNLASIIRKLQKSGDHRFGAWLEHIRTVLPEIETIRVRERPEDRSLYFTVVTRNGQRVPSWLVSDGTRRLFALTILAYIKHPDVVYLVEEPENGIHPHAVQALFDSLSSAYDAQVLLATHSPVFLSLTDLRQLLCFSKNPSGATDIVSGLEHPRLREWKGQVSIADYFASGVLG